MYMFHPLEEHTINPLLDNYKYIGRDQIVRLMWKDGTVVTATLVDFGEDECENDAGEIVEEYFSIYFKLVKAEHIGPHPIYGLFSYDLFDINYHTFPNRIETLDGQTIVEYDNPEIQGSKSDL